MHLLTVPVHRLVFVIALALSAAACDTAEGPSLYDPIEDGTYQSHPNPVLAAIAPPPGDALAGVTELTLTGQNFVPHQDSTFVYFDGERYPVLEITPTTIRMRAPNLPRSGLRVKVMVLRAENFTQTLTYELLPAVERFDPTWNPVTASPSAVTIDRGSGNVYLSYTDNGLAAGIRRYVNGAPELYSSVRNIYSGLYWSADTLFGARNVQAYFSIPPGNTVRNDAVYVISQRDVGDAGFRIRALDRQGDLAWVGGSGTTVNLAALRGRTVVGKTLIPGATVLAIEARENAVYVSASANNVNTVYRLSWSGGALGAPEALLNVTNAYPGLQATALAFSATGNLFVGLSTVIEDRTLVNPTPLLIIAPSGEQRVFYDGLLEGNVRGLVWLEGSKLLAAGPLVFADPTSNIDNALGDLVTINTLQQGED